MAYNSRDLADSGRMEAVDRIDKFIKKYEDSIPSDIESILLQDRKKFLEASY